MTHVRLIGLDVELLTGVLLDCRPDLNEELNLHLQGRRRGIVIARFGQVLRNVSVRAGKERHRLVERDPQRLGLIQCVRVRSVTTEVMKKLLHLARQRNGLA